MMVHAEKRSVVAGDAVTEWCRTAGVSSSVPHEAVVRLNGGPLRVRTNRRAFLRRLWDCWPAYERVAPGCAEPRTTIDVLHTGRRRIDLPPAWHPARVEHMGIGGLFPSDEGEARFLHLRSGSLECLSSPMFLASLSRHSDRRIRLAVADRSPALDVEAIVDLVHALHARETGHHCLHAALVEIEGRGVMLLGARGSGKTTTAAALRRAGAFLLTDETTLVRRVADGRLLASGILTPLRFIGPAPDDVDDLESTISRGEPVLCAIRAPRVGRGIDDIPRKSSLVLPPGARDPATHEVLPRLILGLVRAAVPPRTPHATLMSPMEAFAVLTAVALDPMARARPERQFEITTALAESCAVYRLVLGTDLRALAPLVRRLLPLAGGPMRAVSGAGA